MSRIERVLAAVVMVLVVALAFVPAQGQAPAPGVPRMADGRPDLSGIWQVLNTAAWNVEGHQAAPGTPAGVGVVDGGEIPYQPWALEKRRSNLENRAEADPDAQCYLPGVPRLMYMPFPFQIVQLPDKVMMLFEYAHAIRHVYTNGNGHPDGHIDWWLGDSRGRWDGDTFVVDTIHFNDQTWFDRAGNFHSDALHVVERFTPDGRDHLTYQVTIEDPKVFTRPWTMTMPLYRRKDAGVQLLEYECYAFQWEKHYPYPGLW